MIRMIGGEFVKIISDNNSELVLNKNANDYFESKKLSTNFES